MIVIKLAGGEFYAVNKYDHNFCFRVRENPRSKTGLLTINNINFPKELAGKRVRIKFEVVEDKFDKVDE